MRNGDSVPDSGRRLLLSPEQPVERNVGVDVRMQTGHPLGEYAQDFLLVLRLEVVPDQTFLQTFANGHEGSGALLFTDLFSAQPDKRVLALTGDGEMMMGVGSLGVVAEQAPSNLAILVLDNEKFGETGQQTGLTANRTNLCKVAEGFGIQQTMAVTEHDAVGELAEFLFKAPGPAFATAKIAISEDPWMLPLKDGVAIARRFRIALGLEQA